MLSDVERILADFDKRHAEAAFRDVFCRQVSARRRLHSGGPILGRDGAFRRFRAVTTLGVRA